MEPEVEDRMLFQLLLLIQNEGDDEDWQLLMLNVILILLLSIHRRREQWRNQNYIENLRNYDDQTFLGHFRLRRTLVFSLIDEFEGWQPYQDLHLRNRGGRRPLTAKHHFMTFLWFAGHQTASYRDVADRFDITLDSLFNIITRVSNFLMELGPTVIQLPDEEEKQIIEQHFRITKGFPGIIGALDGSHVRIDKPEDDPVSYINRKKYYSIQLQALVNHRMQFTNIYLGYPGSVHDARVFRNSDLFPSLPALCGNDNRFYILADSAYPCSRYTVVPYRDNGHLNAAKKRFNQKLSSCRIVVEHAFGRLKQRFRQLYHCKLRDRVRMIKFIYACCILHNLADEDDLQILQEFEDENPAIQYEGPADDVDEEAVDLGGGENVADTEDGKALRDRLCTELE